MSYSAHAPEYCPASSEIALNGRKLSQSTPIVPPLPQTQSAFASWREGARALFRFRAHDTNTEQGRSLERYRRATLSTVTSLLGHALGIGTGLLNMRLTLSYLGKERYGLWLATSSLLTWAALADFGLGRGLQNHLGAAYAYDDKAGAGRYVSTGFVTLCAVALLLGLLFVPLFFLLPWASVLNVQDPSLSGETRRVVAAVVICFLASFPLNLVSTVYSSQQRGYVANLFNIVASLLTLGALYGATRVHLDMPWLIFALGGAGLLISALNWGYVIREMPWLRPRFKWASKATLRALMGTSIALLLYQLSNLLLNEAQIIIVAQRLGLSKVFDFTIYGRVYVLPIILISTLDAPMLPAFREAYVRGDTDWLRRAFFRLVKLKLLIGVIGGASYFVIGNFAAGLLSNSTVHFDASVWGACAVMLLVGAWNATFCDLMIATDRLWLLASLVGLNAVATTLLTYWFAGKMGIFGVVIASPVCLVLLTGWMLPWVCRDLLWNRNGRVQESEMGA